MSTPPPTASDRTLAAMRKLVASFFPSLIYWIAHEYSVQQSDGATFAGIATDPGFSPALPTRVPYAPSLAGSSCVVPVGTLAHVIFINADPSKPRCVGFDLPAVPTVTSINAGTIALGTAEARLVREGDVYSVGSAVGPITFIMVAGTDLNPTKVEG